MERVHSTSNTEARPSTPTGGGMKAYDNAPMWNSPSLNGKPRFMNMMYSYLRFTSAANLVNAQRELSVEIPAGVLGRVSTYFSVAKIAKEEK